jgi:predicted metal-binding protein
MEYLLRKALELGAEKAKIIDARTVSVGEWVRWKCQYGCPMHDKDAFHPPLAPDAESTKRVLRDYSRAILLNGPEGKSLTEVAVRLEGEAYQRAALRRLLLLAADDLLVAPRLRLSPTQAKRQIWQVWNRAVLSAAIAPQGKQRSW